MNVLLCSLVQIHSCQEKKEIKCCLNYSGEIYAVGMIKTVTVHQACKQQQRQKQGPT